MPPGAAVCLGTLGKSVALKRKGQAVQPEGKETNLQLQESFSLTVYV